MLSAPHSVALRPDARLAPHEDLRPAHRPISGSLIALCALALLVLTALVPAPARAEPPRSVEVVDTTGSVDREVLQNELAEVDFRTEVDLVVLILDVTDHGGDPAQDTALNDAVLDHARTTDPSLLSEDGEHYAEGTVILALDPENRFLGTYAGEDVKLDDDGFSAVQDAMREDARDAEWRDALTAGAEKYSDLLHRPWWQHPGVLVAAASAVGAAAIWALSLLGLRRAARRRMDETLPRYQDVQAKRSLTDAAARTLPASSPYAQAALQDHEEYGRRLLDAERLHAELPDPQRRSWGWGLASAQRRLARDYEETVGYLDDTDDAILSAADLLHRLGDWQAAWQRELDPLQDSLARIESLRSEDEEMSEQERTALADLESLGRDTAEEMETLTAQLEADQIDPDTALERLDTLTRELSAAVSRLRELRIERVAEDESEAGVLREATVNFEDEEEHEYTSLRARRHRQRIGTSGNDVFWSLSPVLWYSSWHDESTSELAEHRNPSSSSSGSTSGYSGGGFSGAGSSSRF